MFRVETTAHASNYWYSSHETGTTKYVWIWMSHKAELRLPTHILQKIAVRSNVQVWSHSIGGIAVSNHTEVVNVRLFCLSKKWPLRRDSHSCRGVLLCVRARLRACVCVRVWYRDLNMSRFRPDLVSCATENLPLVFQGQAAFNPLQNDYYIRAILYERTKRRVSNAAFWARFV
jgi:hypothetical protein